MKWLFIALVILNIVFFYWQSSQEESKFVAPPQTDSNDRSRRLVLLHELDAELARMTPASPSPALPDNLPLVDPAAQPSDNPASPAQ